MKTKTRKRKAPKREECSFVIEIKEWDFSYSISVNRMRDMIEGPYWEHTDLEMKGNIVYPERLADKEIQVTIMGDRNKTRVMNKPEDYDRLEPKAIGTLTIRGKQSEYLGSVPFDAFQNLCSMISAAKIKYLVLSGQSLYRGSSDIRSISFQEHYGSGDIG